MSGKALTQTNTNFINSGTAEATNGATLALNNTIANSAGATIAATGAGSVVTLAGTFTGTGNNLLTASSGGQIQVNGVNLRGTINTDANTTLILNSSGSNNLDNTTVNGNLDLASNAGFLQVFDTSTVNGRISLGTTSSGLNIYTSGANLILGSTGSLVGAGTVNEQGGGATLTNGGLVNANVSGQTLNITNSNFVNTGMTQVTNGAALNVTSANVTNSGVVNVLPGGTATFSQGLTQTAGLTQVDGVLNLANNSALTMSGSSNGGTLIGSGTINGNVVNNNGTVSPGDSPGTLNIAGNFTQNSGGTLNIEFTSASHDLLNVSGLTTIGGLLDINYLGTTAFTGIGSKFSFLDYSTLSAPNVSGLSQYFSNEVPITNNSGTIVGHNGFTYMLTNSGVSLDLTVLTAGTSAAVPEASTTVSLGLLLVLGMGGIVIAAKRKKKA